ncbi:MAG: endo alpha-1,4 polygalactosaminidase [Geminicoccaceae bacterium]
MAGVWESWRPDAARFPQPTVGRPVAGRANQRWLDIRQASLRPVLERRVDLCRERGFDGMLLDGLDGYARDSGFDLTPAQQSTFDRWLAEVAHAHGLVVGLMNGVGQAAELAKSFDFLVTDACLDRGDCAQVEPFLAAHRPVYLLAYTNLLRRMGEYCAVARNIGADLIFKTRYLNGKLHRRC